MGATKRVMACFLGMLLLMNILPLMTYGDVPQQINYQGYLTDDMGNPVTDGSYEMVFSLYDAAVNGNELWSESQMVTVANGIYNVILGQSGNEFDPNDFDGNLYLGVTVGSDDEMTPRQPLTCSPFAMRAAVTEGVVDQGLTTSMIDNGAITGAKIATDEVTAAHIVTGAVGTSEIENNSVSSTDVGFNYAGSNSKGGPATDVSCTGCVSQGELGFTAGDITAVLTGHGLTGGVYSGNATLSVQPPLSLSQGNWKYATISGTHTNDNVGVRGAYSNGNFGSLGSALYGVGGEHNNGNTGSLGSVSYGVSGEHNNGNYGYLGGSSYGVRGYHSSSQNYGYMGSTSYGAYGRHNSSGNYGYLGSSTIGVRGYSKTDSGRGVYGYATGTDAKGVYGYASYSGDEFLETYGGYFVAKGRRGHGIYAAVDYSGGGLKYAGYFGCDSETGYGVYATVNGRYTNWAVRGESTGTENSGGGYFSTTAVDGSGIFAKGGTDGWAGDFVGNVRIRNHSFATVMELGEGLDYAEGFDVSKEAKIKPGDVLIIDPENPGKLTLSQMPYDTKVAGIAAGAKGLGSGVRLGGEQFDQDVALAGRVYCNVDATETGVEPGDMLTTSSTPGYAKKSTDYMRGQGAILGKAMQKLEKGEKGQILVLVTLQ